MNVFKNPIWIKQFQYPYLHVSDVPLSVFENINADMDILQSSKPEVSIIITAWNEEINILRCIASLSKTKCKTPVEIIVVNNNSTDRTQETLEKLNVKRLFEKKQGCGPARQLGQENASGKYILLADADCLYPDCWVDEMVKLLKTPGTVCVYGRYSFLSDLGYPRWKLAMFESLKDVIAEFRHINRPYFNAYGISMGFIKELGLKVGFIQTQFRGDDGKLCLELMKYGKVKQMRVNKARAWTSPRTLQRDGNFYKALSIRVEKELSRFFFNLHSKLPEKDKPLDNEEKRLL